jgi:hypothetical protein
LQRAIRTGVNLGQLQYADTLERQAHPLGSVISLS